VPQCPIAGDATGHKHGQLFIRRLYELEMCGMTLTVINPSHSRIFPFPFPLPAITIFRIIESREMCFIMSCVQKQKLPSYATSEREGGEGEGEGDKERVSRYIYFLYANSRTTLAINRGGFETGAFWAF